jgi:hypothetical protein
MANWGRGVKLLSFCTAMRQRTFSSSQLVLLSMAPNCVSAKMAKKKGVNGREESVDEAWRLSWSLQAPFVSAAPPDLDDDE